ncbi:MAG: hypothetical protein HFH00_00800 [Dorea sp.]|nr:hypothetical protein [Dorea sp.]
MMLTGILFIGVCVGSFRLSAFGVDAFTCMNLGISGFLHMSFGTWQLMMNTGILIVIFFTVRRCIGLGTIVNMVCVGYLADFICWMFQDILKVEMTLPLRIVALFIGMFFAGMGVALYIVADMGVAPYDAVGIIIEELTQNRLKYDKARVISDVTVVIVGVVFCLMSGGKLGLIIGIGTVCNALFNGPLIQFFKTHVTEKMI